MLNYRFVLRANATLLRVEVCYLLPFLHIARPARLDTPTPSRSSLDVPPPECSNLERLATLRFSYFLPAQNQAHPSAWIPQVAARQRNFLAIRATGLNCVSLKSPGSARFEAALRQDLTHDERAGKSIQPEHDFRNHTVIIGLSGKIDPERQHGLFCDCSTVASELPRGTPKSALPPCSAYPRNNRHP